MPVSLSWACASFSLSKRLEQQLLASNVQALDHGARDECVGVGELHRCPFKVDLAATSSKVRDTCVAVETRAGIKSYLCLRRPGLASRL